MKNEFELMKAKILNVDYEYEDIWIITKNKIPYLDANEWISKYYNKTKTSYEYGKKLVVFLNYLNKHNINYKDVRKKNIEEFIEYIQNNKEEQLDLYDLEGNVRYSTISKYLTVIKSFYKKRSDLMNDTKILLNTKKMFNKREKYLYGEIWDYEYEELIDRQLRRCKPVKKFHKWYTESEKIALISAALKKRNQTIIMLSLKGFRIDEIISMRLEDYDSNDGYIKPNRSKGKKDESEIRIIKLEPEECKMIDDYIYTERSIAEQESGIINDLIFINLKRGKNQGKVLEYHNIREILLRCAKRCGMNVQEIRTHNGRSTSVMELLEIQAENPKLGITDEMIRTHFGWKHKSSIEPYKNYNNKRIAKLIAQKTRQANGGKFG